LSGEKASVDLVVLWHHHQPDYRSPSENRALLPWVRLHATKDYLDMALRLGRHPAVHSTFNFVPSLLDQLEEAAGGGGDALFDLLRRPVASLSAEERRQVASRVSSAPRHAFERWPAYQRLCENVARPRRTNGEPVAPGDPELLTLEVWFLLAWLDPLFHAEPEAAAALAAAGRFGVAHRDGLLGLHDRLVGQVIPAYRALAEAGQVELSESPYYHPILPLLVNVQSARRARPDLALPSELFAAPEDAVRQVERALERHQRAFGQRPSGMWPPEGSVSPEAAEIAARASIRWLGTDEGVLWASLPPEERRREALYRPWRFATPGGEVALFFRDRELSDRIGFVYHHWDTRHAVADFLDRLRRIGREHGGDATPVVSVILDGENCWEHYPEDGGPFLEELYGALEKADDIRTRTPSEVLSDGTELPRLRQLHSGSWINSDFHIWIGHPEKNRAWDLLSRARRALVEGGLTAPSNPDAWESLSAAEGSDWFWWFGDDHFTADKALFDRLFREHLQAAYERSKIPVPGWLKVPIAHPHRRREADVRPVGFIHPTLDGRRTEFYEWHAAGRYRLGAGGGSMHHGAGMCRDLYFGFDPGRFYLRLDFIAAAPPGAEVDLLLEFLSTEPRRVLVRGLETGDRPVRWAGEQGAGESVDGASCRIASILELGVPFRSLGLRTGDRVEFLASLIRGGQPIETLPADDIVRFNVPDETFEAAMWSA